MRNLIILLSILFSITSCQNKKSNPRGEFKAIDITGIKIYPTIKSNNTLSIQVPKPTNKKIKASEIIEDYRYIPLETKTESFMDFYFNIRIQNEHIYVHDITTKMIYIFDMNGKYINKVGKKGNGPDEFVLLTAMTTNPFNNQLVVYDQIWGKLFHFTQNGKFLYTSKLPLNFIHDFNYISPNKIAFVNPKSKGNTHLNEIDNYRVIYTDSCLDIIGAAFKYDDTIFGRYAKDEFSHNKKNVIFNPHYTFDYYQVTDSSLTNSFHIDYLNFSEMKDTTKMLNMEEQMYDYLSSSTYTLSPILFTDEFIWFKTHMKSFEDEFYSYFDKKTEKIKSFKESDLDFDTDFIFSSAISTYNNYIVGYISAENLKRFKASGKNSGLTMDPTIKSMIENLQNDDNDVLILFKLKPIQ